MSVQRVTRGNRARWEVRWREGTRHRAKLFDRRGDAQAWDAELRRRRQLGPLALTQLTGPSMTLGDWITQHWAPEHAANLEQSTRDRYAHAYKHQLEPYLGHLLLAELTVSRLRSWQTTLADAGASPASIHKARTLLSSVLRHAAEAEAIAANPLAHVRAPRPARRDGVRPLAPSAIESIRAALLDPRPIHVAISTTGKRLRRAYVLPGRAPRDRRRDALTVSVLGYAGLRPGELLALRWSDVREQTLLIERATAPDGSIKSTKNARSRTVALLPSLARELREWRLASGRPADDALVVPGPGGRAWRNSDWHNWRSRQWAPACRRVGLDPIPRPYDLRHSFASLLLAEGRQHLEVAQQLGHTPAILLSTYAHLLPELAGVGRVDAELEIASARAAGT